jgi:hypothetical protein
LERRGFHWSKASLRSKAFLVACGERSCCHWPSGADPVSLSVALQMVLVLEGVEYRLK